MNDNLKTQHTWANTRTDHVQISKDYAAKVLEFSRKYFIPYGKVWLRIEGDNKKYSAENVVEEFEKNV